MSDVEPVFAFSEILRHIQKLTDAMTEVMARLDTIHEHQRNISNALIAVQAEQRSTANSTDLRGVEASISLLAKEVHAVGVDVSVLRLQSEHAAKAEKPANNGKP